MDGCYKQKRFGLCKLLFPANCLTTDKFLTTYITNVFDITAQEFFILKSVKRHLINSRSGTLALNDLITAINNLSPAICLSRCISSFREIFFSWRETRS